MPFVGIHRQMPPNTAPDERRDAARRAAELGYAPRYLNIFVVFRFEGESTLPLQAANAHRWAVR